MDSVQHIEALLLEVAQLKQDKEQLALAILRMRNDLARFKDLESKCADLEARLNKSEASVEHARKGVQHFMGECAKLSTELAEYKKNVKN